MKNTIYKAILIALMVGGLAACSATPDQYQSQAQANAQRARQSRYMTVDECRRVFRDPDDCYRGRDGFFYSPIYYPWGAIMHSNGMVSYGNSVPTSGTWVSNPRASSVNFSNASTYVTSSADTARATATSTSASRGSVMGTSTAARGGFGSTASGFGASSGG